MIEGFRGHVQICPKRMACEKPKMGSVCTKDTAEMTISIERTKQSSKGENLRERAQKKIHEAETCGKAYGVLVIVFW